jgi:hypothetical protein
VLQVFKDPITVKGKIRRYEIMWEHEESLGEEIEASCWRAAGAKCCLGDVSRALSEMMTSLQNWSR